ncbi:Fic family protein [Streptomyces sp. NBC_00572]|uniref:Fic family protein n=1 Tax=Streptomyces sp. NBC_00572 TaxID=2903664 RepID=UPI00225234DB|nr:Fic family protein [Streptomyces sp. NBC_00572]MCX4983884.1 Fic family protein [Streptomyces sp. NBC_00572]
MDRQGRHPGRPGVRLVRRRGAELLAACPPGAGCHALTVRPLTVRARRKRQEGALAARAAGAHLDTCFFHPFPDGNARSAFLALIFVLAREGVALEGVGLLRHVTFQADVPQDAVAFARYVAIHLTETRRRATPDA